MNTKKMQDWLQIIGLFGVIASLVNRLGTDNTHWRTGR
jgi:hypothetical protein